MEHKRRKFHGDPLFAAVQKLHISDEKPAPEEPDLSHHAMGHGDPLRFVAKGPAHLEPTMETPEFSSRTSFGVLEFRAKTTKVQEEDIPGPPAGTPPEFRSHKGFPRSKMEPERDIDDAPPSPEYGSRKTFGVIQFPGDKMPLQQKPPRHNRHASQEGIVAPDTPEFSSRKSLGVIDFSSDKMKKMSIPHHHGRHVSAEGIKVPDSPEFSSRKGFGIIDFSADKVEKIPKINDNHKTATVVPMMTKQDRQPSTHSTSDRGLDGRQDPSESPDDPGHGDPLLAEMMHGTPTMPHSDMMMHSKDPAHGGDPLMDAVAHKKGMMMPGSRVIPGRALEPPETPESNSRKSLGVFEFPPEKLVPMI